MIRGVEWKSSMKIFENEWVLQLFEQEPSFFTKRMFGGLAVYLFGRMMMVLVEPTKTGRWKWHGVLVCTEQAQHAGIIKEFPGLAPHDVLKKWLYIDSRYEEFEPTMERMAKTIARDDQRFGVQPRSKKARSKGRSRRHVKGRKK